MTDSSLSVSIFAFDETAAFDGDSRKQSFGLGIRVDSGRTSHGDITLDIAAEWTGRDCQVASKCQVAAF